MRKITLLLFFSGFLPPVASAYCNTLPRLVCAEYANSKAAVIAKLIQTQHFSPPDRQDWFIYTLETRKLLRGTIAGTFRVYEENSSGRATFYWTKGESYLLFLNPGKDGTWWLYGCGNSTVLRNAGTILKVIESLKARKGGLIEGLVAQHEGGTHREGVRIVVEDQNTNRRYKVMTNSDGRFKVHVPAGYYVVRASLPGWSFARDYIMSYEEPHFFQFEDVGCAQVQFVVFARK